MAGKEEELEEKLREVGNRLGSPPASVDELLPLLDQAETFLSRVDQSPSQSMSNALHPVMTALVAKELLDHSDIDVKVVVASCISEITRVTAPDAPYDDNLMKDVFQRIVEAFEKLDDMSSCSYQKRVSILETVAKVRSCVVMLDLECDNLILDMFRHFLNTTSSRHVENVWSSMETIMTLVIEESEDISQELATYLINSVKKDRKDEHPMSFKLGEKVISTCAAKLKPAFMELVVNTALDKYSKIATSVCLGKSDVVQQNDLNPSEKDMADDTKLSERTVSDELPQGSAQLDQEVGCPEVATGPNKASEMMMGNGTVAVGNGASMVDKSPKHKPGRAQSCGQFKRSVAADEDDSDNIESVAMSDPSTKTKGRNRANASGQLAETVDHPEDNNEKAPVVSGRRKGRGKGTGSGHADGPSSNQVGSAPLDPNIKNVTKQDSEVDNGDLDVASGHADTVADPVRPKRGRPPGSKSYTKRVADNMAVGQRASRGVKRPAGSSGNQGSGAVKDLDGIGDSEGKSLRQSSKKDNMKLLGETVDTIESDKELKPQGVANKTGPTTKVAEGSQSKRQQKSNIKPQKEEADGEGDDHGSRGSGAMKDLDGIGDSEGKSLRQSSKKDSLKLLGETVDAIESDKELKAQGPADKTGPTPKVAEGSQSKRQQKSNIKPQKEEADGEGDDPANLSLKEMVFSKSVIKTQGKNKRSLEESGGSKKKRGAITEEVPSPKQHKRWKLHNYDDSSIVGARIRVWWPDDKMFYSGVIEHYHDASRKHKVVYDDGDVEMLLLENEVWELIEGGSKIDGGRAKVLLSPVAAAEMSKSIKTKTSPGEAVEIDTPKSGKVLNYSPQNSLKPKGRPKGRRPKATASSTNDHPEGRSKSKGNPSAKSKEETPKTSSTLKGEAGLLSKDDELKTDAMSEEGVSKSISLSMDDPPKSSKKPGDDAQRISKFARRKVANKVTAKVGSSDGNTPRGRPKSKGIATPKTGDEAKSNVQENASSGKVDSGSAKALVLPEDSSGRKRRRKVLG